MGMRDQARPRADEGGSQIDLTPMLDVVFIMLIFFIVTSSFVKEPGVELLKPQASTMEACERGTIIFAEAVTEIIYESPPKHSRVTEDMSVDPLATSASELPRAHPPQPAPRAEPPSVLL